MSEKVELRYNEDCFAFNSQKRSCEILKQFYSCCSRDQCRGCAFYKPREQYKSDLIRAAGTVLEKYGASSSEYELASRAVDRMG